jgi:DNA-binding PucR family transcriptional regulator
MGGTIYAGIEDHPFQERTRVIETATMFLESGSIKAAAESLYCHRNTVVNRLASLRAATGLDLHVPRDAALATVLLADVAPEA